MMAEFSLVFHYFSITLLISNQTTKNLLTLEGKTNFYIHFKRL